MNGHTDVVDMEEKGEIELIDNEFVPMNWQDVQARDQEEMDAHAEAETQIKAELKKRLAKYNEDDIETGFFNTSYKDEIKERKNDT